MGIDLVGANLGIEIRPFRAVIHLDHSGQQRPYIYPCVLAGA
jgi:hypothetical protein